MSLVTTRRVADSAHGDKLLGGGRVDGHTVVEVRLGGPHLDRHPKPLQHLVSTHPNHVQTHNLCQGDVCWMISGGGDGGEGLQLVYGNLCIHRHIDSRDLIFTNAPPCIN